MILQVVLAFGAGVLALLSPCTAPILPGVISSLRTGPSPHATLSTVRAAMLFAFGAAVVLLGSVALVLAFHHRFDPSRPPFSIVAGAVLILFGLAALGFVRLPVFPRLDVPSALGWVRAPLLGMVLAAIWYPCLGPSLSIAYGLASDVRTVPLAVLMGFAFFAGMVAPLLLLGMMFDRIGRSRSWIRTAGRVVNQALAVTLVIMGALVVTGMWPHVSGWIASTFGDRILL